MLISCRLLLLFLGCFFFSSKISVLFKNKSFMDITSFNLDLTGQTCWHVKGLFWVQIICKYNQQSTAAFITLCLLVTFAVNFWKPFWTQIRLDKMSAPIWIQTVWHLDGIPETNFGNSKKKFQQMLILKAPRKKWIWKCRLLQIIA